MLQSTFQHIRGIGKKTEASLWKNGITSWSDYEKRNGHRQKQLKLFDTDDPSPITKSVKAFERGDLKYFANRLAKSENYRIALTFPYETLFLDIETTGLSLYYDQITMVGWSIGRKYGIYLKDQDESGLREVLKSAKTIVTFNGTIFDLKFLEKTFAGIVIPKIHIDLRFLAKRVGLAGGQKVIEPKVGYRRPQPIDGMGGEAAPILWYRYRRGDVSALKELIMYNHSDIEGMKWILDYAIEKIFEQDAIPKKIRPEIKFSELESKICWAETKPDKPDPYRIYMEEFSGHLKPLITYSELNKIVSFSGLTFIGIDLVSSEDKESGYCILKGTRAETYRICTDEEMIRLARDNNATLVSIDSPLTMPEGRTSCFDDDPGRNEYGIMRECERILKKRGVNVYPCLIPSMQKLTQRGIRLADKFRRLGIPVIESYPGAAQDILAIPRKSAGINYLADALVEFGLDDSFTRKNISHDELDAITSAIVGLFFWSGKFEAIGNAEEEYLIIPDLHVSEKGWLSRKVVGLSGFNGEQNSEILHYLIENGFKKASFNNSFESMRVEKKEEVVHTELREICGDLYKSSKPGWLSQDVFKNLSERGSIVIDGIRFPEEHSILVETFGPAFRHIHVEFPESVIGNRTVESMEKEIWEHTITYYSDESESGELKVLAHFRISNKDDISFLFNELNYEFETQGKLCL